MFYECVKEKKLNFKRGVYYNKFDDFYQESDLMRAIWVKDFKEVKRLVENKADLNSKNFLGETPLIYVLMSGGDLDTLKYLVSRGANPLEDGKDSLLNYAVRNDSDIETIEFLVSKKVDVNTPCPSTLWTPLMTAVGQKQPNLGVIKLLMSGGACVNARDNRLNTPLHYALGDLEALKCLISKGSDTEAKNDSGWTPLMCAVFRRSSLEVIDCLVSHGAKFTIDNEGNTPLSIAMKFKGNKEVVNYLKDSFKEEYSRRYGLGY